MSQDPPHTLSSKKIFLTSMNKCLKKGGFTFMEIVVVIGVLTIAFPALFSMVFSVLQQQTKALRVSAIKREGDYVLTSLKDILRNRTYRIYDSSISSSNEKCGINSLSPTVTTINEPIFEDLDYNWFRFTIDSDKFASTSATITTPLYLTSSQVLISNLSIGCSRISSFAPATIILSFDICYKGGLDNCPTTRGDEIANMHYQSYITLRNF